MKSKKDLILESIQKMESNMLYILLDENKTYQEASKDVFLEKLDAIFLDFKSCGDTHLIPYTGHCNSRFCPKKNRCGLSFVGNNSHNNLDFIFQTDDQEILDLYSCNVFQIDDLSVVVNETFVIEIKNDEKANFVPSVDFLIKQQNCKIAFEELMEYKGALLSKITYGNWLKKHVDLYQTLNYSNNYYSWIEDFYLLYCRLSDLNEFLSNHAESQKAFETYQNIKEEDEMSLLKWLIEFDSLRLNLIVLYEDLDLAYPENTPNFEIFGLNINKDDFEYVIKFLSAFFQHHDEMLKKYATMPEEDLEHELNDENDKSDEYYSLSYHLKKRGLL